MSASGRACACVLNVNVNYAFGLADVMAKRFEILTDNKLVAKHFSAGNS
jgi:hypothetical protein